MSQTRVMGSPLLLNGYPSDSGSSIRACKQSVSDTNFHTLTLTLYPNQMIIDRIHLRWLQGEVPQAQTHSL